jgi:hypothetical protein
VLRVLLAECYGAIEACLIESSDVRQFESKLTTKERHSVFVDCNLVLPIY